MERKNDSITYNNKWDITKAAHIKIVPGNAVTTTVTAPNGTTTINGNTLNVTITMELTLLFFYGHLFVLPLEPLLLSLLDVVGIKITRIGSWMLKNNYRSFR